MYDWHQKAGDSGLKRNVNSMVGSASCSLAKESERLYKDEIRINDVKPHSKSKKREENTKVKRRIYHLQDKDDIDMAVIKKLAIGFKK